VKAVISIEDGALAAVVEKSVSPHQLSPAPEASSQIRFSSFIFFSSAKNRKSARSEEPRSTLGILTMHA
jgi:hypothetical protein